MRSSGKYVGNRPIRLSKIKDDQYGSISTTTVSGRKVSRGDMMSPAITSRSPANVLASNQALTSPRRGSLTNYAVTTASPSTADPLLGSVALSHIVRRALARFLSPWRSVE
jgi:hypothetical protein